MSDYHPDGGQLFFPRVPNSSESDKTSDSNINNTLDSPETSESKFPFFVCLGKNTYGDDIKPENMRGFKIPAGKGVYIHPGTWHNGVYINREYSPKTVFTRQGRVHARVSCSWAAEFDSLLRMKLV
jgi:hypothetical protein